MKSLAYNEWVEANQQYLHAAIAVLYQYLARQIQDNASTGEECEKGLATEKDRRLPESEMNPPATLQTLCSVFSLTEFERDILLICVGVELDSRFASLMRHFRAIHGPRVRPLVWRFPYYRMHIGVRLRPMRHYVAGA